jgi:type IV secretory pathway VirB2 component (pilin)
MNSMITGSITNVNLATGPFGTDLANLGRLINLHDLGNFGSPLALVRQLYSVAGSVPFLQQAFSAVGITVDVVLNIANPTASVTDSVQQLMYQAMTQITGNQLTQVLTVLEVTTTGIETMADLLNPLKLFPNSYQSLTAPTATGPAPIYVSSVGSVNTALATQLPAYVISSLV